MRKNLLSKILCFNPCTYIRYDDKIGHAVLDLQISTHVPVKDTTSGCRKGTLRNMVSIHVPVKDTTQARDADSRTLAVSTHVPVKDTTACLLKALFITFSANDSANNDIRQ